MEAFLATAFKELSRRQFHELLDRMAFSGHYEPEACAKAVNQYLSFGTGVSTCGNMQTDILSSSLEKGWRFANALQDPMLKYNAILRYYEASCDGIPELMELITSDLPKEHPLLWEGAETHRGPHRGFCVDDVPA